MRESQRTSANLGLLFNSIVGGLGGIITFIVGYVWVIVEAFNKSMGWGLSCVFIPFCKNFFELKNWESARPPLTLMVIGMFAFSSVTGAVVAWGQQQKNNSPLAFSLQRGDLESRLEKKAKVVACIKNVRDGQTFQVEDLEEREIEAARIPNGAVTSASLVAGRRAKFGFAAGHLISQHDLER